MLEAAKFLQIKGLYETSDSEEESDKNPEKSTEKPKESGKTPEKSETLTGSQKRKIRKNSETPDSKKVKTEKSGETPDFSPLFGISNAYFLNNPPPLQPKENPTAKLLNDLPTLLSQNPLPLPTILNGSPNATANLPNLPKLDLSDLSTAPVRRYKQYTEDTLQQALKVSLNTKSGSTESDENRRIDLSEIDKISEINIIKLTITNNFEIKPTK